MVTTDDIGDDGTFTAADGYPAQIYWAGTRLCDLPHEELLKVATAALRELQSGDARRAAESRARMQESFARAEMRLQFAQRGFGPTR